LTTLDFAAIVFPTLWEYLKSLGVPEGETYYLGLCIAALSLTDMVTGLIAGRLADKFSRVSLILLALLGFEILASVLYLVASSPAMIVASRLVGGTYCTTIIKGWSL
jgi:MFS family permease